MGFIRKDTGKKIEEKFDVEVEEELEEVPSHSPPMLQKKQIFKSKEMIVNELPQVSTRRFQDDDGSVVNLKTTNEALKEILDGIRELLRRTEQD